MANVPHSTLTGSDLHIIKGADVAAAGQVPVANGSGDAPFGKLTHTSLQTTGNPFGAQLFHVRDQQNSGSALPNMSGTTWTKRVINTVATNEVSGASLASNTITLPAGTYFIDAAVIIGFNPANSLNGESFSQARFRNSTDSSTLITSTLIGSYGVGASDYGTGSYWSMLATLRGRFSITGTKNFEIDQYTTNATGGLQLSPSTGEDNVFLDAMIWKLA